MLVRNPSVEGVVGKRCDRKVCVRRRACASPHTLKEHSRSYQVYIIGEKRSLNVIAVFRVGRSEACLCARLISLLRVAVFGAQHHCAACCAVLFLPLILCCVGMLSALPTVEYNTLALCAVAD